ncbi:hypothetical protein [Flavihumibacter sp. UBA7668]|uniref:hypothetical protein n=1 Tax=Flavihumibacter sp. UBA7668 TaxID=1946542 RepID=UPI0025BD660C|nr:hypothetical protein [Flavihumibacter sp. UBA7668]
MKLASIIILALGLILTTSLSAGYKSKCSYSQAINQAPDHEPIKDAEIMELSTLSVLVY